MTTRKIVPAPAATLPPIVASEKKGCYWFIVFDHPLDEGQVRIVRETILNMQDARGKFLFSHDLLPKIPEKGDLAPLRQRSGNSTALRIARAGVDGYKPSLAEIVKRLMPKLEKFIATSNPT